MALIASRIAHRVSNIDFFVIAVFVIWFLKLAAKLLQKYASTKENPLVLSKGWTFSRLHMGIDDALTLPGIGDVQGAVAGIDDDGGVRELAAGLMV